MDIKSPLHSQFFISHRLLLAVAYFALILQFEVSAQVKDAELQSKIIYTSDTKKVCPEDVSTRKESYLELFKGQRNLWNAVYRKQSGSDSRDLFNAAKKHFLAAASLNPCLSEAFVGLAETALTSSDGEADDAIRYSYQAIEVNPESIGAQRILARIWTFKSGIGMGNFDRSAAENAVKHWKVLAKLTPKDAETWGFLADFYEKLGNKEEQISALKNLVAATPPVVPQFYQLINGGRRVLSSEQAAIRLGEALLQNGNVSEALKTLCEALSDQPGQPAILEPLVEALNLAKKEDILTVLPRLKSTLEANPSNLSILRVTSEAYMRAGLTDKAFEILQKSEDGFSRQNLSAASETALILGDQFLKERNYIEALKAFRRALNYRLSLEKTEISDKSGNPDKAQKNLKFDSVSRNPFIRQVFTKMILAAKASRQPEKAIQLISEARSLLDSRDEFADRQMIDLLRETGRRSEALSIVRKLLEIRPNDEMLARLEATILIEIGKSDEAVNLYKKRVGINNATSSIKETGVKTATDLFSSLVFLSQLYQQAAKSLEAIETAKQAIKIAQSPERIQLGLLELASAQQSAGRFPDAENTLREILKKSPNNPIALNNLGYFLLERGERFDEALSLIQKAVESDPTNPSYLDSLGWAYFKLGRLNEAEEYLKRAIGFDPTSPTINEHLGDVMEKLGKIELARDHWQRAAELTSDTKDLARIRSKLR